jgi:hypothetical protein
MSEIQETMSSVEYRKIGKREEFLSSKHLYIGCDRCLQSKVIIKEETGEGIQWIQCTYGKDHEGMHSYEESDFRQKNIQKDNDTERKAGEGWLDL